MNTPLLYLASGSPRRREILESLGYRIERLAADIDETPHEGEAAYDYVLRMACEKNTAALARWHQQHPSPPAAPVLTADTTVALDTHILGKPEIAEAARRMLQALSGRTHQVLTAVCLYHNGTRESVVQTSDVQFKSLSDAEIDAYIAGGEPLDKAGAYGIQGLGGVFVQHLQGSFTGVMGLPVFESCGLLQNSGYPVPPFA